MSLTRVGRLRPSVMAIAHRSQSTYNVFALVMGGGVAGSSVAYHLTKRNIKDVLLLEKEAVATPSGTSYHSPGLVSASHPAHRYKPILAYSVELYSRLSYNWASLSILKELAQYVLLPIQLDSRNLSVMLLETTIRSVIPLEEGDVCKTSLLSPEEVAEIAPVVNTKLILGALYTTNDGMISASGLNRALVTGAKAGGVQVVNSTPKTVRYDKGLWHVELADGSLVTARNLLNAGGIWANDIARLSGHELPMVIAEHQYATLTPSSAPPNTPAVIDHDSTFYLRKYGDKFIFGGFEPMEKVVFREDWYQKGVPQEGSRAIQPEFSRLEEAYNRACELVPSIKDAQVEAKAALFSMTADGYPLVGPFDKNYWVSTGFLDGVSSGGGIGRYIADWMADGEPPLELFDTDASRYDRWATRKFIVDKSRETYSMFYNWSYTNRLGGRPTDRVSGVYGRLKRDKGHFLFRNGWEVPQVFDIDEEGMLSTLSREYQMVTNKCGVIDMSWKGKIEVKGEDSDALMNYAICTQVLSELTKSDVSEEGFPQRSTRLMRLGLVAVVCARSSTSTGQLSYELFHNRADSARLYQEIIRAGAPYGVVNFGQATMNMMRLEHGYKIWGRELTLDTNPFECGLGALVDFSKEDFIGKAAALELSKQKFDRRLALLTFDPADNAQVPLEWKSLPFGMEVVRREDMMAHGAHNGGENVGNELIDYFQRSRAQKAYNIDLLEQKYRRIEEQGLDTGIEIDFVNNITYAPKNMSKRAVCAKINKYEKKEFGLAKISAPCNSLEVFGKGYAKRAKECRQLDSDFNATFKMKFPKWQPYEPRKRRTVKRTIRETVKELVFDNPLDYLHYIMKIKGLPSHIFERRGVLPLPMVAGDCSKSRESSPVRNSLAALKAPALPSLMVASSEDCSRSRECSPTPQSPATPPTAKSDLATATSAIDKTSVHRSGKGRKRNRRRRRKASSKSTPSQSSPPVATPTSNNASALIKQDEVRDKNCSSTMATTSSTTRKRRSDGSDPVDTSFLPSDMPSGLWDESVQTIVKSYEESFPAISKKMTILGFDAQEFRNHFGDSSQTTLSSFVNFTREYQDLCGENYLDNGLKEDRRAMAAAKSRNRVLKDGYFA
ncbi:FAD dependent oxidoreductase [Ostertagia ostertagi]